MLAVYMKIIKKRNGCTARAGFQLAAFFDHLFYTNQNRAKGGCFL